MVKKPRINKQALMAGFIVIIMVASIGGFVMTSSFNEGSDSFRYNGIKFKKVQDTFKATINNVEYDFYYHPDDVSHVNISDAILDKLDQVYQIQFTSDPNSSLKQDIALVEYTLAPAFNDGFNLYTTTSFNAINDFNVSVITCEDATDSVPVMEFRESDDIRISMENNCIIVEGYDLNSFLSIRDRLLYKMLKVV